MWLLVLFAVILAIICATGFFFVKKWKREKLLERRRLAAIANAPLGPAGAKLPAPGSTTAGAKTDPDPDDEFAEPPVTVMPADTADPLCLELAAQLKRAYDSWQQTEQTYARHCKHLRDYNQALGDVAVHSVEKLFFVELGFFDPVQMRLDEIKVRFLKVLSAFKTAQSLVTQLLPLANKAWKEWTLLGRCLKKVRRYKDAELPPNLRAVRAAAQETLTALNNTMYELYAKCKRQSKTPPTLHADHQIWASVEPGPFELPANMAKARQVLVALKAKVKAMQDLLTAHQRFEDARNQKARQPAYITPYILGSQATDVEIKAELDRHLPERITVMEADRDLRVAASNVLSACSEATDNTDLLAAFAALVDVKGSVTRAEQIDAIHKMKSPSLRVLLNMAERLLGGHSTPPALTQVFNSQHNYREELRFPPPAAAPAAEVAAANSTLDQLTDKLVEAIQYDFTLTRRRARLGTRLREYDHQKTKVEQALLTDGLPPENAAAAVQTLFDEYCRRHVCRNLAYVAFADLERSYKKQSAQLQVIEAALNDATKGRTFLGNHALAARLQNFQAALHKLRQELIPRPEKTPAYQEIADMFKAVPAKAPADDNGKAEQPAVTDENKPEAISAADAEILAALKLAVHKTAVLQQKASANKNRFFELRAAAVRTEWSQDEPAKPTEVLVAAFQQTALERVVALLINNQEREAIVAELKQALRDCHAAIDKVPGIQPDTCYPMNRLHKRLVTWTKNKWADCTKDVATWTHFTPALVVPVTCLRSASSMLLAQLAAPPAAEKPAVKQPDVEVDATTAEAVPEPVPEVDPLAGLNDALRTLAFAIAQSRVAQVKYTTAQHAVRPADPNLPNMTGWQDKDTAADYVAKIGLYLQERGSRQEKLQKMDKAESDAREAWTNRLKQVKSAAEALATVIEALKDQTSPGAINLDRPSRAALVVAAAERLVQIYNR